MRLFKFVLVLFVPLLSIFIQSCGGGGRDRGNRQSRSSKNQNQIIDHGYNDTWNRRNGKRRKGQNVHHVLHYKHKIFLFFFVIWIFLFFQRFPGAHFFKKYNFYHFSFAANATKYPNRWWVFNVLKLTFLILSLISPTFFEEKLFLPFFWYIYLVYLFI